MEGLKKECNCVFDSKNTKKITHNKAIEKCLKCKNKLN